MAWQDVLTPMVRVLIGDDTDTQRFDNARIEQAILVAGLLVTKDYKLSHDYTFDFSAVDISPDPTVVNDTEAIALFGLKAACMLNLNAYQAAVSTGIRVRDGDSEVDTTGGFKGYSDIIALGPCGAYSKLLASLNNSRAMNVGRAVMSPFGGDKAPWGVRGINGVWHIRSLYDSFTW